MHINRLISLAYLLIILALAAPAFSQTDDDNATVAIVERNLFHPERKKYVMEPPRDKKEEKKQQAAEKKELDSIQLYGTAVTSDQRYAVLRTKKDAKKVSKTIFSVGDYVSGYLITAIDDKKVSLRDDAKNEDFVIFINQGAKDRTTSAASPKTEIKEEPPTIRPPSAPGQKSAEAKQEDKPKEKTPPRPKEAQTADVLKKRLERDLKVLKGRKSTLVKKQAQKDYGKLEALLPSMSDQERQAVLELRKELDNVLKE